MKKIEIRAKDFFELLKERDTSMWDIFSQMIDGEARHICFLDEEGSVLFDYILPQNIEKLQDDQKIFAAEYSQKLARSN